MSARFKLYLSLVVSLIATDQAVKAWARAAADGTEGRVFVPLWPGVFELKLVYNEGIAFGMLEGMGVMLAPVAVLIAAGAAWFSWKHPQERRLAHVTMALLSAGAIGNLIDRLWLGRVTDMFFIRLINFPVFNVADICITFAGAMLAFAAVQDLFHKKPPDETAPPEGR